MTKIVLSAREPGLNPTAEELAGIIVERLGLTPRKEGSTEKMHKVLVELYEKQKKSSKEKKPEAAVITVEEMALLAGISRQTMYDYLSRWLDLNLIVKMNYMDNGKLVSGYKLNGPTIEAAFERAATRINDNLADTKKYIEELQRLIKNEKIKASSEKESY